MFLNEHISMVTYTLLLLQLAGYLTCTLLTQQIKHFMNQHWNIGCMENPERQNNLDQPEQLYFCDFSHVQTLSCH